MIARLCFLAVAAAGFAACAPAFAQKTAIVGAHVFDGTGAAPYIATVIIDGDRIESVEKGGRAPKGATVVNGLGLALLPGFFDLHTHYYNSGEGHFDAPANNRGYVAAGVTTVADYSQAPEAYAARRAWYGEMPGPTVLFAGRMSTFAGHGADWGDRTTTKWVDTPYAAKQAASELAAYKPDVIKAFTDGWRYGSGVDNTSMDLPTLSALVAEAHAHEIPVLTHTVTVARGKLAGRAGVDVIAHAMQDQPVDAELIDLLLKAGASHAPTLAVYEPVKPGQTNFGSEASLKARQARFELAMANVKALHDAGVPIALGTDAGNAFVPHGPAALHEMELLVRAGLTPSEALAAGTSNSAKAIGFEDRGVIAPGNRADLVLIDGRPWDNISDVKKTVRTFVGGKVMFGKGAPRAVTATVPPAIKPAQPLIADFERVDGRTAGGALPVMDFEIGKERSSQVMSIAHDPEAGRYLSVQARMGLRETPKSEVVLPLAPGGVQPVDARAWTGVKFSVRGDGGHAFGVTTPAGVWAAPFAAAPTWSERSIVFSDLAKPADDSQWTAGDLLSLHFITTRAAGETAWLEIDNVSFY